MKKFHLFLAGCLFLSLSINANNTDNRSFNQTPFIFLENGIEYAVFNNGDFDFNIIQQHSAAKININTRNINLSFNTGRNYKPYIQTDRYGAITQIERTAIVYDRYGKVSRIGNININYNYQGLVSNIGNLNIYYNNYGTINNRRGYINSKNINYRPRYQSYKRPINRTITTYNKQYKQKNIVNKYNNKSNSNNYTSVNNKNRKSNNKNSSSTKNKTSTSKKTAKQKNTKKETYRTNSNSYRRTSKSSDSQYASTSYQKR